MRIVLQRVANAKVQVAGETVGEIGRGYLILLGVSDEDTELITEKMADKICKLRIFEDKNGKTNLSLSDVEGDLLVISQFTLYADCKKGNRPSFTDAGNPELARRLYGQFMDRCRSYGIEVKQGCFGEHMEVSLVNDGPFTLMLDSKDMIPNSAS